MKSMVRISALLWADILVGYALFVMQKYLTDVWNLSFTHAAGILNVWNGISMVLPVFFLFFVDVLLGNRGMLIISSISYSVGIGFVTMSTPSVLANSTGTCKQDEPKCIGHTQKALFYTGMALIAVGTAGSLVSVRPFLEEQPDDDKESPLLVFFKILSFSMVVIVPLVGAIALPYIKPWKLRFGIPAICTAVSTFFFLTGLCCFKYRTKKEIPDEVRKGNPVINICRVFVAAVCKLCMKFPQNDQQYKRDANEKFKHTRVLRGLHKAAIKREGIQVENKWTLCSVSEVEEAKIAVRMVPMWLNFIICGIVSSIGNTYFVEQADHLDRHIGKWNVPLQALLLFSGWWKKLFGLAANRLVSTYKTYGPPVGIGVAMVFSILCCITAAKTEQRRLHAIRKHDLIEKPDGDIPMSVYWLLFQFCLLAGLDSFFEKSVVAFYNDQAPDTMKSYLVYLTKGVFGLGFMFSVLTVHVVGVISEKGGKPNWFRFTLNKSRLDRYYWVLAALSAVNLIVFVVVASCYTYKSSFMVDEELPEVEVAGAPGGDPEEKQYCSCFC